MVGYFKKVFAGTCISIFIVGLVAANSHQSLAPTSDPKDHTKVISDTGERHQIFELRANQALVNKKNEKLINETQLLGEKTKKMKKET